MLGFIGDILEKQGKREFHSKYSPIVNKKAENIVIAGKLNQKNYNSFEQTVFKNYSKNQNSRIYTHERYRENIENSDKIHEEAVEFFDTDYSSSILVDILEKSGKEDRSIFYSDKEYKEDLNRWVDKKEENITLIYE